MHGQCSINRTGKETEVKEMKKIYAFCGGYDDWDNPIYTEFFETKEDGLCYVKELIEKKVEEERVNMERSNIFNEEILKNIDLAIEKGIQEFQPYTCGDKMKEFYETFERLKENGCPISICEPWGKGKGYAVSIEKEGGVFFSLQCIPNHSPKYTILEDLNKARERYNKLKVFDAEEVRKSNEYLYNRINEIELWSRNR